MTMARITGAIISRIAVAALASAAFFVAGSPRAQQPAPAAPAVRDFDKVVIKTTDLGSGIYMLEGEGGNIALALADDGVFMVDSQFAQIHYKIKAAVDAITS